LRPHNKCSRQCTIRDADKLALHKVTSGSWGAALASESATINDSTAYTIKVFRRQFSVRAWVVGQSASEFTYESSSDFGTGQSGLYSDKTSVTFDDFTAYDGTVRDSLVPRFVGPVDASISSGALRVQSDNRGGQVLDSQPTLRVATQALVGEAHAACQGSRASPTTTTWSR
jgi:hypothetical protein